MKKKTSLSAKLIAAFMAAILGSVLICALLTHSKVESVLNSNMQLTSEQTLNSAMTSLQTYEKTISIPVDLLTRKDSIKQLLLEPENYDKYIDNVNDELVAACKVVNGSVRAYCEFPYKSRVMPTSEPLKTLKAPYMARNTMKWGFFRLKSQ